MVVSVLHRHRAQRAKKAFTTRRVPTPDMRTLLSGDIRPVPGDVVLATVQEIGKQKRLELRSGRRAHLIAGDEIVVAYGNRYATDQFEALIGDDLGPCDLVAAGGLASREICRHERMPAPTWIAPVGLVGDADGRRINLADYAVRAPSGAASAARPITAILVVGSGMNAGKTFAAASTIRGFRTNDIRVAGVKITGTGAGGDLWQYRDMGADVVYDFTDAGYASTYKTPIEDLEDVADLLVGQAARAGCDYAVVEVADGLEQEETEALLRSPRIRRLTSGVLFSAYDAMGAQLGVERLRAYGHNVLAVSGQICRSPLAMREAAQRLDVPVRHPEELRRGALIDAFAPREEVVRLDRERAAYERAGDAAFLEQGRDAVGA
ncbi:MAG: hypothetical protein ACFB00_09680 [Parvularculaceae bacterium]